MATIPLNSNGHRRRQLRARVLAEETHCALCGGHVNQTLPTLHPRAPVVDEDLPRSRGGSPYDRDNCHLMHRECNGWKGRMTLTEAKAKRNGSTTPANGPKPTIANLIDW